MGAHDDVEVHEIGSRRVPPDPSIAEAVGRHHSLATAVADLVDNSIDAGAGHVHVRFLSHSGLVDGLRVIDDGRGMDGAAIDRAMTFGGRCDYGKDDLGNFGLGLKAASLSQADALDVYSIEAGGSSAVGRRILADDPTTVAELDPESVAHALAEEPAQIPGIDRDHGTVVEWRGVRTFLSSSDEDDRAAWLVDTVERIRTHLGLVLHRIIARGDVAITVDEFDLDAGASGVTRSVEPIDPLGYRSVGRRPGTVLRGRIDGEGFDLDAHVWPASQKASPAFRLFGLSGGQYQGFFVYRNDRLLQAGGWNGVAHRSQDLDYARIALDIDRLPSKRVTINPEKSGVEFDADFRDAVEGSIASDGTGFRDFLEFAEGASRISRRRHRRPVTLSGVTRGLSPALRNELEDIVTSPEQGPIEIRWRTMRDGSLTRVDLEKRTLWLNSTYRAYLGASTGEADDAPFVKMLLLLVYSKYFEGEMLGAKEKDELRAWDELLHDALDEELERRSYGEETNDGR
jgi:hypothetical protein